jgi:glycosyltransferase involved in cell wall biosynthesis
LNTRTKKRLGEPIHVCHLVNEFWYGGIQETVYNLCKGMPDYKHFVLAHTDGPMKREFMKLPGVFVSLFPGDPLFTHQWDRDYTGLDEFVLGWDIDIVHKQMGGGDESRMLWQLRDPAGGNICKIVESMHCPRRCNTPEDLVDHILVASRYTYDMQDHDRETPVSIVHYGTEPHTPRSRREDIRDAWDIPHDAPVVGRIGRLSGSKLVHETVLAFLSMAHSVPDLHCVIGGCIPQDEGEGYYRNLESRLKHDRLRYIGSPIDAQQRADWLSAMDICVYPTRDEGFGMVFVEAMHQGLPIITYDHGANAEVVDVAGIVLPWSENDNERISNLAGVLLHHTTNRRESSFMISTGPAARLRGKHFTHTAYADRVRTIYESVL